MRSTALLLTIFAAGLFATNLAARAQVAAPALASTAPKAPAAAPEPEWVKRSNQYTQMLLDVQFNHSPEGGSQQGLAKYDTLITNPTRADEIVQRKELQDVLAALKKVEAKEKSKDVREDMEILQKTFNLQFRQDDYQLDHKVPFIDASAAVFGGLRGLLDDQVAAERRPAAVSRLRKYAGVEPGYKPFTNLLKQRVMEQMAKPGVVYPSVGEMETELGRDKNYVDGLRQLFVRYKLIGWEEPFEKLREELADYDTWIRATVMPKARSDFKLAPRGVRASTRELWRRYSAGTSCRDGAPGLRQRPGGDADSGGAGGEGAWVEPHRLSRCDPRTEEEADHGRRHSALLQSAAEGD